MTATLSFERRDALDTFAIVTMVGLTFTFGLSNIATKVANMGFNPIFVVTARSTIAIILILLWCRWRQIPLFLSDGTLRAGLLVGVLFGLQFVLMFVGLEFTSVARAVLLANMMPFFMLIGAHYLLGERMDTTKVLGLVLAFAGVAVIFGDRLSLPGPDAWIGDLMNLAASAIWAAIILVIKKSSLSDVSAEKVLSYQLGVSIPFSALLLPFAGPILRDPGLLPIGAILFQACFITTVAFIAWFWMIRRYPASSLSSFIFLTPAFGVIQGGVLLDEPLSWWLLLSLGLIAAGLLIVNRPRQAVPPTA